MRMEGKENGEVERTVDDSLVVKTNSADVLYSIALKMIYADQLEVSRATISVLIKTNTLNTIATLIEHIERSNNVIGFSDVHFSFNGIVYNINIFIRVGLSIAAVSSIYKTFTCLKRSIPGATQSEGKVASERILERYWGK